MARKDESETEEPHQRQPAAAAMEAEAFRAACAHYVRLRARMRRHPQTQQPRHSR
jgi:hypothetical protein